MHGLVDAILFDLDDTLVDWEGSIDRCVRDLGGDDAADRLLAWGREHTWIRRRHILPTRQRRNNFSNESRFTNDPTNASQRESTRTVESFQDHLRFRIHSGLEWVNRNGCP